MKRMITLAALSALLAAPVSAQVSMPTGAAAPTDDSPELKKQKREAAARILSIMRPVWTDEQIGRIMYIGWYSGAAALCDDLEVDPVKLEAALKALEPQAESVSSEKAQFLERNLMMHVGMATGWVMAGHLREVPKFCAEARKSKADMPADRHLFETATATPK